jgi:hypothetical protein
LQKRSGRSALAEVLLAEVLAPRLTEELNPDVSELLASRLRAGFAEIGLHEL